MKQLLRENFSVSLGQSAKALPLNETTQLVEDAQGNSYKSRGAYTVDISRYDHMNLNDRWYSKNLWEDVITSQQSVWEGSVGLMDHPQGGGSTKDEFCVWHNLIIDETNQVVKADMYLIGHYGQQVKEKLDAGGRVELSTSGFGDVNEQNHVVDYTIERPADHVYNASQQVFATKDNEIVLPVTEDVPLGRNSLEQSEKEVTILTEQNLNDSKENLMSNKIQEELLLININGMLKNVESVTSLTEKKSQLTDILKHIPEGHFSDVQKEVTSKLVDVEAEISKLPEQLENANDSLEEEKRAVTDLNEKVLSFEKEIVNLREDKATLIEAMTDLESEKDQLMAQYRKEMALSNTKVDANTLAEKEKVIQTLEIERDNLVQHIKTNSKRETFGKKESTLAPGASVGSRVKERTPRSVKVADQYIESEEVQRYFDDLVKSDVLYEEIKDDLLASKTVKDARIKAMRYEGRKDREANIRRRKEKTLAVRPSLLEKRTSLKGEGWL